MKYQVSECVKVLEETIRVQKIQLKNQAEQIQLLHKVAERFVPGWKKI